MYIAQKWDLSTGGWDGDVTEACIFDYTIGTTGVDSQLSLLYNEGVPTNPFAIAAKEPIAYWRVGDDCRVDNGMFFPNLSVGGQDVFNLNKADNGLIALSNSDWINENTPDSNITVSAWVNPVSWTDTAFRVIVGKFGGGASTQQWRIVAIGSDTIRFNIYGKSPFGASYTLETDDVVVPVDKRDGWLNIIWRHAPGIGSNVKFNNENETALPNLFAKPLIKPLTGSTPNTIGGIISGGSPFQPWDGELSNIQFFETYLTDEESTEVYNGGRPLMTKPQPQQDNLAGWWKLDSPSSVFNPGISGIAFVATQIGTPAVGGGGDHAYVNPSLSPLVFECQDLNSAHAGGPTYDINIPISDGIGWESLLIKGAYDDLVIETDIDLQRGGASGGAKAQLFYSVDGGAWTSFGIINVGVSDPLGLTNFLTNSPTLSCLNSIQFRAEIGTRSFGADRCRLNSIKISNGGDYLYDEDFSSQSGAGWNNSVYVPANNEVFVEDYWDINDSRSAYPQSFDCYPGWIDLDGSNLGPILNGLTNFTLSLWYFQDVISNRFLFDIQDGTNRMALQLVNAATNYLYFNSSFNSYSAVDTPINQWNNIVFVFDGSQANADRIKLYVNGSQITAAITGTIDATLGAFGGTTVAHCGAAATGGSLYALKGKISNCQIFDSSIPALGGDSVETLYNKGVPPTTAIASANLVGWWKLDNTALYDATTLTWSIPDDSGNGNTGTSSGMTLESLVNDNVSNNNGITENVPQGALQKSNVANTQAYSNYSFNFDAAASDGFVISYQASVLQPSNAELLAQGFSVSAWVNLDTSVQNGIWQNDGYNTSPINYGGLLLQTGGPAGNDIINVGYSSSSGTGTAFRKNWFSTAVLSPNTWHNIIVVYRGILEFPLLYVDGTLYTGVWTSSGGATTLSYNGLGKGSIGFIRNQAVNTEGLISNVALFNGTLSEADAETIYNNGITQNLLDLPIPPPTCWYPLDESSTYYGVNQWTCRDIVSNKDGDGVNTGNVDDLIGKAPGSYGSGTGTNLTYEDLQGQSASSIINSISRNMADYGTPNSTFPATPADSGRTTNTPGP